MKLIIIICLLSFAIISLDCTVISRYGFRDELRSYRTKIIGRLEDSTGTKLENIKVSIIKEATKDNCYKYYSYKNSSYTNDMGVFSFEIKGLVERYNFNERCDLKQNYYFQDSISILIESQRHFDTKLPKKFFKSASNTQFTFFP